VGDLVDKEQEDYASYLLRLRRSEHNGQAIWWASLESARDGQKLVFSNLQALIGFLEHRFGQADDGGEDREGSKE
jgi:hypothetical protein